MRPAERTAAEGDNYECSFMRAFAGCIISAFSECGGPYQNAEWFTATETESIKEFW